MTELLVTRPDYDDTTFYLCEWAEDVIQAAKSLGHSVIDLKRERANRKNFEGILNGKNPDVLFLNGHGTEFTLHGHNNEQILDLKNMHLLARKVVYVRSCRTAKILGFESVKEGISKAFIGYKSDFIFPFDSRKTATPKEDKVCEPVLSSSNLVVKSLMHGKTPKESYESSQKSYESFIMKWAKSKELEAPHILKFLIWNKVNQVLYENTN